MRGPGRGRGLVQNFFDLKLPKICLGPPGKLKYPSLSLLPPKKKCLASRMKCIFIKLARFNMCIPQQTALTLRVLQCKCTLRNTGNIQNNTVCKPRIIFFKNDQCLLNYTKHGLCNILNDRESLSLPFLYIA